jgi:hypothetical protein
MGVGGPPNSSNQEPGTDVAKSDPSKAFEGATPDTVTTQVDDVVDDDEETEEVDLDSMGKKELLEFAEANDIEVKKSATVGELRETIRAAYE